MLNFAIFRSLLQYSKHSNDFFLIHHPAALIACIGKHRLYSVSQSHINESPYFDSPEFKEQERILIQAGIAVEELSLHRQDLESYFLERMGGADHV